MSAEQTEVAVDVVRLERLGLFVLEQQAADPDAELSVALVDEQEMRRLNERYTGEEGPTDVLAFPLAEDEREGSERESDGSVLLGDVILCPSVAARDARDYSTTLERELSLLLVHGTLHLLGYDHADDEEARAMRDREAALLEAFESGGRA